MVYPYGLQNFPAVGGGSPGLPRRRESGDGPKPADPIVRPYSVLFCTASGEIANIDLEGNVLGLTPATTGSGRECCAVSVSWDQTLAAFFLARTISNGPPSVVELRELPSLDLISSVEISTAASVYGGVAISKELGLIAISVGGPAVISFCTLDDFIQNNGGVIGDLNPFRVENHNVHLGSMEWSKQGDLFVAGSGTRLEAQAGSTSGSTYLGNTLRHWPSLDYIESLQGGTAARLRVGFTRGGEAYYNSANGTSGAAYVRELQRDQEGVVTGASTLMMGTSTENISTHAQGNAIASRDIVLMCYKDQTSTSSANVSLRFRVVGIPLQTAQQWGRRTAGMSTAFRNMDLSQDGEMLVRGSVNELIVSRTALWDTLPGQAANVDIDTSAVTGAGFHMARMLGGTLE